MSAEEILISLREVLDENSHITQTSHTLYCPDKLQKKVSFAIFEQEEGKVGLRKRFSVTVEDFLV